MEADSGKPRKCLLRTPSPSNPCARDPAHPDIYIVQTTVPLPVPDTPLDIDITNGPWELLQNIFPNTNFLATPHAFEVPQPQTPISVANVPTPLPYTNNAVYPLMSQDNVPAEIQLSYEEWDQVMRDFQMEVEKSEPNLSMGPSMGMNVTEWFA
ncbi:Transcription factor [Penicillium lagena]|uniref:Transcription factor n=1 Tax=Penicillium lagena TaxID=94218 RepID=UPI0025420A9B|nr:Transcription factor [Penicillium lagena]KAJ5619238.1 Transcription factor [Penicillium lagena]